MNNNESLTYKKYLMNILPNMFAHLTTPLAELVEVMLLGRFLSPLYIGSFGVAMTILNTFKRILTYLRTNIITESAQSLQKGDKQLQAKVLTEHIAIAFMIGSLVILCKEGIWRLAMFLYKPSWEVTVHAKLFFDISIWAMPVTLTNYMIMGWLFGRGKSKRTVTLEVMANTITIILGLLYLKKISMQRMACIEILTQAIILLIGMALIFYEDKQVIKYMIKPSFWCPRGVVNKVRRQKDIFRLTLCIVMMSNLVMMTSCRLGNTILSANIVILQLKDLVSFLFEGISTTMRGISAKAKLGHKITKLKEVHKMTLKTVMYLNIGIVMIYVCGRFWVIEGITGLDAARKTILTYDGWLATYPIVAGWGISAYGFYLELTQSKIIGTSMYIAFMAFLVTYAISVPTIGNHGLWLAITIFYLMRSLILLGYEGYLYD